MPMDEKRKEYLRKYKQQNLKRIPFEIRHEDYARVKIAAEIEGVSVNRYIRQLIDQDLNAKKGTIDRRLSFETGGGVMNFFKEKSEQQKMVKKVVRDPYGHGFVTITVPEDQAEKFPE